MSPFYLFALLKIVQYLLINLVKIKLFSIVLLGIALMGDRRWIGFLGVGLAGFYARFVQVCLGIPRSF
jgi:hypothetical protein